MPTKSVRNPNYNQLDLLKDLFKTETRETIYIKKLIDELENFKYIRSQVGSSELSKDLKIDLEILLNYILWSLSGYLFEISRHSPEYRETTLEQFRKRTETPDWISTYEVPELELIQSYFQSAEVRLKATFIGFKEISKGYDAPQEIIDYLRKANLLLH